MSPKLRWCVSPWDHKVHAFDPTKVGEVVAEAVCSHSARTARLAEDDGHAETCQGCRVALGQQLADPALGYLAELGKQLPDASSWRA